eukprot:12758407-Alexandrium_andersonii.AAC.1
MKDEYTRTWNTDFGQAHPYDRFAPSKVPGPGGEFITRDIELAELRETMLRIKSCSDMTWRRAGDHI